MKFIDLFCGMGSFHYAMMQQSSENECVMACDIDERCRETYERNYGVKPLGDIKLIRDASRCDVLFAGFPCVSFSRMGKQKGLGDDRGQLIFDVFRLIKLSKPSYIVLENVKDIFKYTEMINLIRRELLLLDYFLEYRVLNCWEYGIPQNRSRVFFVATKKRLPPYVFPDPPPNPPTLSAFLGKPFVRERILTIRTRGYYSKIDDRHNFANYALDCGAVHQLTEEELLIFQGFPRDFPVAGIKKERISQIGNTIPTCLSCAVVANLCSGSSRTTRDQR
jgi:DNA (cytosine-5)-methyltransferase 1